MKSNLLLTATLLLCPVLIFAQTTKTENLSNLMGALNQVIGEKTKVAGVNEEPVKITPPAAALAKTLANDLELCQTSKTSNPEVVKVEKDGVSVQFKKFNLRIYGEKCPLEINVDLNSTEETSDTLAANFKMSVVFKTDAFIQKYKMKFIEAGGTVSAKAEKTATGVHLPVHVDINSSGESTELGPISQSIQFEVTIDANLAQFSFNVLSEQKATLQYGGKNQKAYSRSKMVGFTQPEIFFSIDDNEVSESEFQTFMQSFVLPTVVNDKDPNAPDSKVTSQCAFLTYDKKSISAVDLKAQMQKSALQKEGLLTQGQSCMSNVAVPFQQGALSFTGQMTFGEQWISFAAISKSQPEVAPSSVYVLYGDDAVLTHESESLVIGLQCKVVPACR